MYAIIDLETTGGKAELDKITEIGIVIHDGEKIIDTFSTLINPERSIPYNIIRITGITDSMVKNAPKFYEVAKKVVEITKNTIFVAHNVRFDYSFLQEEFRQLGFTFTRKQMCTVRLARKVFPGLPSYSLGNLIRHFAIPVAARHRALDDAMATAELFNLMIRKYPDKSFLRSELSVAIMNAKLPLSFDRERVNQIPDDCGVYYYYNSEGKIVYIGKSLKIKSRFLEHFQIINQKAAYLQKSVVDMDYLLTGSDLIAQIIESIEIKKHKPEYNKAQRMSLANYVIVEDISNDSYQGFKVLKIKDTVEISENLGSYTSKQTAERVIFNLAKNFQLCPCRLNTTTGNNLCIDHERKTCFITVENFNLIEYQRRTNQAILYLKSLLPGNKIIFDRGRVSSESSFVLCENNKICGYGYIDNHNGYSLEDIKNNMISIEETPEIRKILNDYIRKNGTKLKVKNFQTSC